MVGSPASHRPAVMALRPKAHAQQMRSTHLGTPEASVVRKGPQCGARRSQSSSHPGFLNHVHNTHLSPPLLAACPQAHQNHFGLDLPHPNNTLARHLPRGRGRPLGGWPRGWEREHELPRSSLRKPSPQDRRTRQARALTAFRGQGEEPHVTYPALPSHTPQTHFLTVRLSMCHWLELP